MFSWDVGEEVFIFFYGDGLDFVVDRVGKYCILCGIVGIDDYVSGVFWYVYLV